MRLLTVYLPRMPADAATECRSCRFATPATTGRLACRSLQMEVQPDWGCRDHRPSGDAAMAVTIPYEEGAYAVA